MTTEAERLTALEKDMSHIRELLRIHQSASMAAELAAAESRREVKATLSDLDKKLDVVAANVAARENQAAGAAWATRIGMTVLSIGGGVLGAFGVNYGVR